MTLTLNANHIGNALDHLSQTPILRIMLVGTAGVAGMFMGQSTSASASPPFHSEQNLSLTQSPKELHKSLMMPLNLFPSSWRFDPTFILLQGAVPEETLLVVLAEGHLDVQSTDRPSEVNPTLTLPSSRGS